MTALSLILVATLSQQPTYEFKADQPLPSVHAFFQKISKDIKTPKVGEWVRYELTRDTGRKRKFWMQMAIVGAQKDEKGRDAVWVETEFANHPAFKAPLFQMRTLCALGTEKGLLSRESVTRVMLAFGPEKPVEASKEVVEDLYKDEDLESDWRQKPIKTGNFHLDFKTGKPTALMTYAGTVTATPFEGKFKGTVIHRIWFSEQIPLFRVAKFEVPKAGHTLEIRDYGVDARSRMVLPDPKDDKLILADIEQMWRKIEAAAEEERQP